MVEGLDALSPRRKSSNYPTNILTGLLKRYILQPFETCGFFNTEIKGNRHLQVAMFNAYNVRIPDPSIIWLWVKNRYRKWNPGKWNQSVNNRHC